MTGAVVAERLTKFYGSSRGVEDLSFEARPGEVFGFLGPNGAGKTTTIRLMLDFLRPTRGSIRVLGLDPRRQRGEVGVGQPVPAAPLLLQRVEHVRQAAREIGAIVDRELPGIGTLRHHLQRALVPLAEQTHAHELEPERGGVRFDHAGQSVDIGQVWSFGQSGFAPRSEPRSPLHLTM